MEPVRLHEVKIRDLRFFIRRFPPFEAMEVLGDLQKQFASPLMGGMKPGPGGADILLAGLGRLSADLDGKTLRAWAEKLLDAELVAAAAGGAEPEKLTRDMVQRLGLTADEIFALCVEVVKHNFAGFSTRWSGLISSGLSLLAKSQQENSARG